MPTYTKGNLIIHSVGARQLAIWTHGGYTPRRGPKPGSGTTTVPRWTTLHFHTPADTVGAGDKGRRFISGNPTDGDRQVFERVSGGSKCADYSLSVMDTDNKGLTEGATMDYLVTEPGTKIHLSDLWTAMKEFGLEYNDVHYFACRINKMTYTGEIEAPAVDRELFFRIHGRYPDA